MSTNLQKIPVKISWHSDVWSMSYSDLNDASLDILKTMDSKQFRVLIYHCFLIKKNTVHSQQWLEKCYGDSAPSKTTSLWIKNDNVSLIPSAVRSCFAEINRIFCVGMWQWTKSGSITTLRSQSHRQPSGLQSVRSVHSGQKRKCVRYWASVFWDVHGVLFIDWLEKGKTINSERYIGQLMRLKNEIGEKWL